MRVQSLHLCTRLLTHLTHLTRKFHPLTQLTRKGNIARNLLIGVGFAVSLNYIYAIEDETIRSLKYTMSKEINALRSEYGQTTVYP
jgi:hypothetical protein